MNIEYTNEISEELKSMCENEHIKYENNYNILCNYTPFYFLAKENNVVKGVISGFTCYKEIYIDDFVVFEKFRKKGIGKNLIMYVENHFKGKGFNNINLVTNQFQAPEFYKKCGFDLEFIRENKEIPNLTKYFFIKYLDN